MSHVSNTPVPMPTTDAKRALSLVATGIFLSLCLGGLSACQDDVGWEGLPDATNIQTDQGRADRSSDRTRDLATDSATDDGGTVDTGDSGGDRGVDLTEDSATDTTEDTGPVIPCGTTDFAFDAGETVVTTAVVAGSFNGWVTADSPDAWHLEDPGSNNVWTTTRVLDPGRYEYKFVINDEWYTDPNNPDQVSDGFDGFNSVLEITCDAVRLVVINHSSNETGGVIRANLALEPDTETLDTSSVTVTLNHDPIDGAEWSVAGNMIQIDISGARSGIHDLRVRASSTTGAEAKPVLLKFYLGLSTDWRDTLLYFAMTDRFRNGDNTNDEAVGGSDERINWQGGDFAGITTTIGEGYFDDLGVSALWISWPIDNFDGSHGGGRPTGHSCGMTGDEGTTNVSYTAYHGYWPRNLDRIDGHFGTLEDLRDLVDAAHAHGIRILLDFTANHVHTSSPLFRDHKYDYFNWPDNGADHVCRNVGWDTEPETCWFTDYLADLDYRNPEAVTAVVDMAMYWIFKTGADGFRVDAVKHINSEFLRGLRRRLGSEVELTGIPFYLVGETFTGDAGDIASFLGDDMIHGQFDFPLNQQIIRAFAIDTIGLSELNTSARGIKTTYGDGLMSNFIGNHDIARFASMAAGDIACRSDAWDVNSNIAQGWQFPPSQPDSDHAYQRLRLAFTYIMTIPGIPLIYYGDEFGMPGAGDPDNRRMMRFDGGLNGRESATLTFLQRLGTVRSEHSALRTGTWGAALVSEADVLAYSRSDASEAVFVALNRGSGSRLLSLDVSGLGISSGDRYVDALSVGGGVIVVSGNQLSFSVPAGTAMILVPE